jgi:hypothetical protein
MHLSQTKCPNTQYFQMAGITKNAEERRDFMQNIADTKISLTTHVKGQLQTWK